MVLGTYLSSLVKIGSAGPPPDHDQAAQDGPGIPTDIVMYSKSALKLSPIAVHSLSGSTNSSTTTLHSNEVINQQDNINKDEQIPQFDGLDEDLPNQDQPYKCETRGEEFETERNFKKHDSFSRTLLEGSKCI